MPGDVCAGRVHTTASGAGSPRGPCPSSSDPVSLPNSAGSPTSTTTGVTGTRGKARKARDGPGTQGAGWTGRRTSSTLSEAGGHLTGYSRFILFSKFFPGKQGCPGRARRPGSWNKVSQPGSQQLAGGGLQRGMDRRAAFLSPRPHSPSASLQIRSQAP